MPAYKKLNCIAVDDEPPALEVLKKYIAAVPNLNLVTTCANALEAFAVLQQQPVDLVFLDILMPQLTGTDLVRSLKKPPKIIFTTAYRKFALEGFELDAVDFLLKPISFERFLKAVNKVMDGVSTSSDNNHITETTVTKIADSFINLRADRKNIKVALDDILYIESLKDYIKVVTVGKTIITKQSISSIEEILPKDQFIRIHRSFIVSIKRIETFTNEIIEIGNLELPISRMYKLEVNRVLQAE